MSYPGIGGRRPARRGLASVARATAGECPSCARVASGPQRRPAGAHKEGAVRIDARYNAVLPAFDFQTLKMSDGQSLAHLPRFLREKLEKANARVGVRALPLVKHVALRGTNQHLVNRRTEIVSRSRLGRPDPLCHH